MRSLSYCYHQFSLVNFLSLGLTLFFLIGCASTGGEYRHNIQLESVYIDGCFGEWDGLDAFSYKVNQRQEGYDLLSHREIAWLEAKTSSAFQHLMNHLEQESPLSEMRRDAILSELNRWPDLYRQVPNDWISRLSEWEDFSLLRFPRALLLRDREIDAAWLESFFDAPSAVELFRHLTVFEIGQRMLDEDGALVLASMHEQWSPSLREFSLFGNQVGGAAIIALLESGAFDHLRYLNLGYSAIEPANLKQVLLSPRLEGLQGLGLRLTSLMALEKQFADILETGLLFRSLRSLDISDTLMPDSIIQVITESGKLSGLESLNLSRNYVTDQGIGFLVETENLGSLQRLELFENHITEDGLARLIMAPLASQLQYLGLGRSRWIAASLSKQSIETMISPENSLTSLKCLSLRNLAIGAEGIERLTSSDRMRDLVYLNLTNTEISEVNLTVVPGSSLLDSLPNLRYLRLDENCIGDDIGSFLAIDGTHTLRELSIRSNHITEDGLRDLLATFRQQNLLRLDLTGNPINEEILQRLRDDDEYLVDMEIIWERGPNSWELCPRSAYRRVPLLKKYPEPAMDEVE